MKTCFKCGKTKSLDSFYYHSGMADKHLNKCKECTKIDVAKNYRKNIDHYVSYEKERGSNTERRLMALEYQKRRRIKAPIKFIARHAISNALRDGRITKHKCEICKSLKVQAHHDNYSNPFDVHWLCKKHHDSLHDRISHSKD